VRVVEEDWCKLGLDIHENAVHMRVSGGSKIKNLLGFAIKKFKEPEIKQLTWNGSGQAVAKAISCAEIMKRKIKDLHQINKVRYHRIEEFWEPKLDDLERLKVNRDIPAITILLSKEELDSTLPGYQAPGSIEAFLNLNEPSKKSKGKNRPSKRTPGNNSNTDSGSMSWTRDKKSKKRDQKPYGDNSAKSNLRRNVSKTNTNREKVKDENKQSLDTVMDKKVESVDAVNNDKDECVHDVGVQDIKEEAMDT